MIGEYDGSGALQRRYVFGPGLDEPIVQYEGGGTTDRRFLSSDERGSVIARTSSAGALLGINSYDEYGVPAAANAGRFGYTGQAFLPELGLNYYKARMYHPGLGRFLQTDPIGYESGLNLYAYVGNDPINWVDPLGLQDNQAFTVWGNPWNLPSGGTGSLAGSAGTAAAATAQLETYRPEPVDQELFVTATRRKSTTRPPPPPKPEPIPCSAAIQEQGAVVAVYVGLVVSPGGGVVGAFGSWKNVRTGTHGGFVTYGGIKGADISASAGGMLFSSLNAFAGPNVNVHGSIPFLSLSISTTPRGSPVGIAVAPGPSVGAGAGVSVTKTELSQCRR